MSEAYKSSTTYQLGDIAFSVVNCERDYEERLNKVLPSTSTSQSTETVELKTGCSRNVRDIIRMAVGLHPDIIWILGSCLVSPIGARLLLAGPPSSGKSTLAMMLVRQHGWQLLSEAFVLIDPALNRIVPFAAPFSFKDDSVRFLQERLSTVPPLLEIEWSPKRREFWSPIDQINVNQNHKANFESVVFLDQMPDTKTELSIVSMTHSEALRKALFVSNLLKKPRAVDSFMDYISDSRCMLVSGGDMGSRLQAIEDLCVASQPRLTISGSI
jgi:hypothetical protein